MNKEAIIMYAAFGICVIQVIGDQFFSYDLNSTAFLSFLAVGGGANALTTIKDIIGIYKQTSKK